MPINRGGSRVTSIRRGSSVVSQIRRGSALVWSSASGPGSGDGTFGDYFDRANAANLGGAWTNYGPSTDMVLGIENGSARVKMVEGLIGGFFDLRTSRMRFNGGVANYDNMYVEVRMTTRGDGFSPTSLSGFKSQVFARLDASFSNGVGIEMNAGVASIIARRNGLETFILTGGNFQGGDVLRLSCIGNTHRLFINGASSGQWNDNGPFALSGPDYRGVGIRADGGKDLLGPRRFSPAFDYVVFG